MTFDYELIHSRRRSIGITVERDRRVIVRAPIGADAQAVSDVVAGKRLWIWKKLRDPRKYPDPLPRKEYVSGESFLFLGQGHRLVLTDRAPGAVSVDGSRFELARVDRRRGDQLFRAWYLARARERLAPRITALATEMGVKFQRVWVRDLRYRWGSCSPGGTLTFNWRIIQAPMIVVDYLIAHELAHVLEPNHSPEFWNIVAIHAPSWVKARGWLKEQGAELEW